MTHLINTGRPAVMTDTGHADMPTLNRACWARTMPGPRQRAMPAPVPGRLPPVDILPPDDDRPPRRAGLFADALAAGLLVAGGAAAVALASLWPSAAQAATKTAAEAAPVIDLRDPAFLAALAFGGTVIFGSLGIHLWCAVRDWWAERREDAAALQKDDGAAPARRTLEGAARHAGAV